VVGSAAGTVAVAAGAQAVNKLPAMAVADNFKN
jgi:hypothetical protein